MKAKNANTTMSARKRPSKFPQPEVRENFVRLGVVLFLSVMLLKLLCRSSDAHRALQGWENRR